MSIIIIISIIIIYFQNHRHDEHHPNIASRIDRGVFQFAIHRAQNFAMAGMGDVEILGLVSFISRGLGRSFGMTLTVLRFICRA